MTKEIHSSLGKIFAREIVGTLPFQSKAKIFTKMEEAGLVEKMVLRLPGRFVVTVEGWALTDLGRMAYCANCK